MSGKATLILVMGFSTMFLLFGINFLNISKDSTDNMMENISETRALDIAKSATNVIISNFWQKPNDVKIIGSSMTYFDSVKFNGGYVTSKIKKVPSTTNLYQITTTGYYGSGINQKVKTVMVIYGPQQITEMASYCNEPGNIWWTGADTVKGGVYSKKKIPVFNHPTFEDYVYTKSSDFKYYGGKGKKKDHYPIVDPTKLNFNFDIPQPKTAMSDLKAAATSDGWYLNGKKSKWSAPAADTLFLDIKGTSMDVKFSKNGKPVNYNISSKAPNGIIFANNYVVRLKGELDGQLSVVCNGKTNKGKGKILLDDDITYKDDPRTSASDDLLGIVASGSVEVADTPPNKNDININAAIFSSQKGLTAENAKTKPDAGDINFFGSLIENKKMEVGRFDPKTGQLWGYGRSYEYDSRLKTISPPNFPQLSGFHILSWYEGDVPKT